MTTTLSKLRNFGSPYHGRVISGALALPNGKSLNYPQPIGQMTRLVRGKKPQVPLMRDARELENDRVEGFQWLDHAYLSGSSLQIGGYALGNDKFVYSDGERTWLLRWWIEPSPNTAPFPGNSNPRHLKLAVVKLFGEVNPPGPRPAFERAIYNETFANPDEDFTYVDDVIGANYTTQQSADGAILLVQCHAILWVKSLAYQKDFLMLYPWLFYATTAGYEFFRVLLPDQWHIVRVSGVGSTRPGSLGEGIKAELDSRAFFDYGVRGYSSIQTLRTISPDGKWLDFIEIDETHGYADKYSEAYFASGVGLPGGWQTSIQFSADYDNDRPTVGLKLVDGGLLNAYPLGGAGSGVPTHVHGQARRICGDAAGRTYDIANDLWFPTGCVV